MRDEDEIAPDSYLPSQQGQRHQTPPSYGLAAAVLEQAAADYRGGARARTDGAHKATLRQVEVDAWIKAREPVTLGSFVWWCDLVGLDVDAVEARIRSTGPIRIVRHAQPRRDGIGG